MAPSPSEKHLGFRLGRTVADRHESTGAPSISKLTMVYSSTATSLEGSFSSWVPKRALGGRDGSDLGTLESAALTPRISIIGEGLLGNQTTSTGVAEKPRN